MGFFSLSTIVLLFFLVRLLCFPIVFSVTPPLSGFYKWLKVGFSHMNPFAHTCVFHSPAQCQEESRGEVIPRRVSLQCLLLRLSRYYIFYFRYDTDNPSWNISRYRYQSDISTLRIIHTFMPFFVVCCFTQRNIYCQQR